ncbi:MAG: hypothetical protein MRQ09_05510 [Candidatus Midichloria sp.]|nr:hypothetical protein [Candidatus Midichloria sp.]
MKRGFALVIRDEIQIMEKAGTILSSKLGRTLLKARDNLEFKNYQEAVKLILKEDKSGLEQLFKEHKDASCDSPQLANFSLLQLSAIIGNEDILQVLLTNIVARNSWAQSRQTINLK